MDHPPRGVVPLDPDTFYPIGTGRVVARYPSRATHEHDGELGVGRAADAAGAAPVVLLPGGEVVRLDPRAVVTLAGAAAYHPRENAADLDDGARTWLLEHPDWAAADAPEAWPAGTRVRKAAEATGDMHRVGERGTVAGSLGDGGGGFLYAVRWDDSPATPKRVPGHKLQRL